MTANKTTHPSKGNSGGPRLKELTRRLDMATRAAILHHRAAMLHNMAATHHRRVATHHRRDTPTLLHKECNSLRPRPMSSLSEEPLQPTPSLYRDMESTIACIASSHCSSSPGYLCGFSCVSRRTARDMAADNRCVSKFLEEMQPKMLSVMFFVIYNTVITVFYLASSLVINTCHRFRYLEMFS